MGFKMSSLRLCVGDGGVGEEEGLYLEVQTKMPLGKYEI